MAKGDKSRIPSELPEEVLYRLNPKLRELYSQLPSALASRISALMRQALPQRIHPDRVLKFAFLYATAEVVAQRTRHSFKRAYSALKTRAGWRNPWAKRHGLGIETMWRQSNCTAAAAGHRQQVKASLEALQARWRAFKQVVQKHREERLARTCAITGFRMRLVGEIGEGIAEDGNRAVAADEDDLASEKGRELEHSAIAQAYIWWRLRLATYRGNWSDMHRLALAWHMSPTGSEKNFRKVVSGICKGAACTYWFGTSWESVLSQKS